MSASGNDSFQIFQRVFNYIVNGPVTTAIFAVGILLNCLCVCVFINPTDRHGARVSTRPVIYFYLICLACWESTLLLGSFLMYSLPTVYYGHLVRDGPYVVVYPYAYMLSNTTLTGSCWVVMTLTVDRYFALCHPLTHKAIMQRKRVKKLLLIVSLSAIIFSLPRFFELTTNEYWMEDGNYTILYITQTAIAVDPFYMLAYRIIGGLVFYSLVPSVVLFALTIRISMELRQAAVKRRAMSYRHRQPATTTSTTSSKRKNDSERACSARKENSEHCNIVLTNGASSTMEKSSSPEDSRSRASSFLARKRASRRSQKSMADSPGAETSQHSANVMLMVVIVKFLLSHLLPTALDVTEQIIGSDRFQSSRIAGMCVDISNLLVVLNSASNFWVYLIFGQTFKVGLRSLFIRHCCKKKYGDCANTTVTEMSTPANNRISRQPFSLVNGKEDNCHLIISNRSPMRRSQRSSMDNFTSKNASRTTSPASNDRKQTAPPLLSTTTHRYDQNDVEVLSNVKAIDEDLSVTSGMTAIPMPDKDLDRGKIPTLGVVSTRSILSHSNNFLAPRGHSKPTVVTLPHAGPKEVLI